MWRPDQYSPAVQYRMAAGVLLLALLIAGTIVFPVWTHYRGLQARTAQQREELRRMVENAPPPPGPIQPAMQADATEPGAFVGLITRLAASTHCRFLGLEAVENEQRPENTDILPVRIKVDLEAKYPAIRRFLNALARSERLMIVTRLQLNAVPRDNDPEGTSSGIVRAAIEIERYVTVSNAHGAQET
ncbi:MAG: GspMb/PilO family protein [Chloroherpetonaceae bacterium]|nr:type II secretion system protein M [Chthonomonadaceae bacterium]MDW8206804.1 GspMb/PilO family protein [Chloroherpetonaceae bacterium]